MEQNHKKNKRSIPNKYTHITYEMRKELISLVQQKNKTIPESCNLLGIKKSTAKSILRQYRRKGKVFRRKSEKKHPKRKSQETNKTRNQLEQIQVLQNEQQIPPPNAQNNSAQHTQTCLSLYPNLQPGFFLVQTPIFLPVYPNFFFSNL